MKKIIYLFWLICIISFSNYNAQTASTVCVNSTTLSAGSYSNLQTFNSISWFTLIPNVSSNEIHLTNVEFNPLFKIKKIEIYDGPCSNATLIASDSLTESTDSTLIVSITGIDISHNYSIKLYRELTTSEPSNFKMNILAPEYCGFSWSLSPPNFISYNPLTYVYTYDYNDACLVHNTTGVPINTALWSNSHNCVANITSGCSNNSSNGGIIYISYSNVAAGNPGTWLQMNVPIAIIPNVAGATYTTLIASSGSLALSLNVTGATSYTIVAINGCDFSSINPNTTFQDIESCSCNHLVVNVTPFNCNINVPNPLCANQPFCIGTFTPALNVGNYTLEGQTYVFQAQPIGGGTSINATVGTYSNNNVCFNSGLPQGNYNLVFNQTLVYFYDGTSGPLNYTCSCTNTVPVSVFNMPTGPTSISASPSTICDGETTTLTANTNGATNYIWQPGNINSPTLVVTPSVSTAYTVQSFAGTCPGPTAQITIELLNCCKFPKNFGVNFTNVTIQPSNYGGTSIPWSSIVPGGTYNNISILAPPSGNITSNIAVTGSLTINANNLSFNNCNFLFSEAAVVIQNANNTTFNKSYLRACIKNWRGIVSNAALTVRNTVIEDAQYAVFIGFNTIIHPGITIENTLFNKNLVGVAILNRNINGFLYTGNLTTCRSIPNINYNFASSTPWQYQPALNVTSLLTYPSTQLLGSSVLGISNLVRSQQGVLLLNANQAGSSQGILVGNTHPSPVQRQNRRCVYDNLRIGVSVINSTVSVINSYLQQLYPDISQPLTAAFYLEHSRGVFGNSATGAPWFAAIYTNTVDVVVDGVVATNQSTFTVANNIFQNVNRYANNIFNINYGLAISNNLITNNTFTQCNYDLFAFDNRRINLLFENNSSSYTVGGRPRLNYYVYVNEINKPSTAYYQVRFNTPLNGKQNGFTFLNTYGARIDNNNINIVPPTGSSFNANITLQNSDFCEIKNNNLDVIPNALASFNNYGILTDIGANNLYCGNDIKNSGTSLKFQGPSPSRIFNNSLNNNPGNPCQFGIWLDNSASIGPITFTTAFGNATGNNEFGDFSFADTYSQLGSLGSNIDYQGAAGTGNIYYPFINLNDLSGASVCNPISNSFVGPTNCNSGIMAFLQNLSRGVPPFLTGIVNFGGNTANANAMARKSIFELFKKGIYNTTTLVNYNNFMTSNAAANVGKFYNVDSLIYNYAATNNTANIANAQVLNSAISSTNIVEQNQITFNTIYHTYLLNPANITGAQKSTLQTIAQLCPFTDGTSVYQARAILRYFDDSTYYSNPCEVNIPTLPNTGSRLGTGLLSEKTNEVKAYETKLYPNPTKGEVIVTTELTDAEIIVINILGQVVLESKLTNETKLDLSLLKEGTYLYKIIGNGIVLKSDKLIINH